MLDILVIQLRIGTTGFIGYHRLQFSEHHARIRDNVAAPSDKKVVQDIQKLMTQWTETSFEYNFNKTTVVYGNELAAPFARIVYHKSISLGCTITQCAPRKTAYACAYSDRLLAGPMCGIQGCHESVLAQQKQGVHPLNPPASLGKRKVALVRG
ncbi:hypothetical protein NECAME_14767 [Necator americanus]|uniref:SCP domain-containing protein n=1 Tax=Necator americanus TaxID=51031 RepID=W2SNJ6_NECAM|nr:hypothetical protein NECAME_14767 [Necator americanus]ETN70426.1 hypothetical protein NECAME_14767 [Necator americanus]